MVLNHDQLLPKNTDPLERSIEGKIAGLKPMIQLRHD